MENKPLVFYPDWEEAINALPEQYQLAAYKAVTRYAFYGEEPTDPIICACTLLMRTAIDRERGKNEKKQEAGRKGMSRRWSKKEDTDDTQNVAPSENFNDVDNSDFEAENVDNSTNSAQNRKNVEEFITKDNKGITNDNKKSSVISCYKDDITTDNIYIQKVIYQDQDQDYNYNQDLKKKNKKEKTADVLLFEASPSESANAAPPPLDAPASKSPEKGTLKPDGTGPRAREKPDAAAAVEDLSFQRAWDLYDKKRGNTVVLRRKWNALSASDRRAALEHIPRYVAATPDKQFRKDFQSYINQRAWCDEIIQQAPRTMQSRPVVNTLPHYGNPNPYTDPVAAKRAAVIADIAAI